MVVAEQGLSRREPLDRPVAETARSVMYAEGCPAVASKAFPRSSARLAAEATREPRRPPRRRRTRRLGLRRGGEERAAASTWAGGAALSLSYEASIQGNGT